MMTTSLAATCQINFYIFICLISFMHGYVFYTRIDNHYKQIFAFVYRLCDKY